MGKLDLEARMTIQHLRSRGLSQSSIARLLGVTQGAVRYHVDQGWCRGRALTTYQEEKPRLGALPILPEPFELVATRRVNEDCLVHFESHSYSVPFAYGDRRVEVRGCARRAQILAEGKVVVQHARHTREHLVIDPHHL